VSISVHVQCYSSYTYAQEPRALEWGGRRFEVVRVVKRWRTPTGPVFRVEVAAAESQIIGHNAQIPTLVDLHYLETEDRWTMRIHT
jgi:hypothetical protein